jgi:N-acetylglucosaminyl-diphospho-decaprenol L-rhamnosyltransferase
VIAACLDALSKMAPEITSVVVDNASQDATMDRARSAQEMTPGVQLIANPENRGFAAAVNQGVRATDAEFILLLNPDTRLLTAVDDLVQASRQHGLAAGKLVDRFGRPQRGFTIRRFPTPLSLCFELFGLNRLWPSNFVNRRYRYLDRDLDQPGPVDQPAGAFLMFRREVWEALGGLDESFHPVWFEDVDFCRRAASAGYRIEYLPSVAAEHVGAHSLSRVPEGCRSVYWCASLLQYGSKHFRSLGYRGMCLAVVLTSFPRAVAGMIRTRSTDPITVCFKIVGSAGRRLISAQDPGRS